jgi:hypothetical protein
MTHASLISSTNDTRQTAPRKWTEDISCSHHKYNGNFGSTSETNVAFQYLLTPQRMSEQRVSSWIVSHSHSAGFQFESQDRHRILCLKTFRNFLQFLQASVCIAPSIKPRPLPQLTHAQWAVSASALTLLPGSHHFNPLQQSSVPHLES